MREAVETVTQHATNGNMAPEEGKPHDSHNYRPETESIIIKVSYESKQFS